MKAASDALSRSGKKAAAAPDQRASASAKHANGSAKNAPGFSTGPAAANSSSAGNGDATQRVVRIKARMRFCKAHALVPTNHVFKVHLPPAQQAAAVVRQRARLAAAGAPGAKQGAKGAAPKAFLHNISNKDGSALADAPHHPAYQGAFNARLPRAFLCTTWCFARCPYTIAWCLIVRMGLIVRL